MSDYSNILKALKSANTETSSNLTWEQRADNYTAFDELMKEGVHIPSLMKRITELEERVKAINTPQSNPIDSELFFVMEDAVSKESEIIKARDNREHIMEVILTEVCMKDPRYVEADKAYHTAVNSAYIKQKSGTSQP